jgi:hypothetical protein
MRGLRFQFVDRHPWNFHFDGAWFFVVQALLATPLLFAAMAHAAVRGWHGQGADDRNHAKYFALIGGGTVVAFCLLGFFADNERISFHWTLAGLYALLPLVPATLAQWPRGWRRATWVLALAGLVAILGYYVVVSSPVARARFAAAKWYPANFAGWDALADAVRDERAKMPADARIVADNFKIGSELGFALDDPNLAVLPHGSTRATGARRSWMCGSCSRTIARRSASVRCLLVVGASEVRYRELLQHYHALCDLLGPLPPPRVVNIDHGRQRFVLFRMPAKRASGECTAPAMAYIDSPRAKARVSRDFEVGRVGRSRTASGIARVEVTLDGEVIGVADYGQQHVGIPRLLARIERSATSLRRMDRARARRFGVAGRALARPAPDRARRQRRTVVRTTAAHRRLTIRAARSLLRATCARSRSSAGRSARSDRAFRSHRTRAMPKPSVLKLPAQSKGCSAST